MRTKFLCLAVLAAILLPACRKEVAPAVPEETGTLLIQVDPGLPGTKAATPDITAKTYETRVRKVDILVFDEKGQLNLYYPAGTALEGIKLSVTTGTKDVWAVINGPDLGTVIREADLKALKTVLEDNSTGDGTGAFIMAGNQECEVAVSQEKPCTVTVERFAARISLTKVEVALPAAYDKVTVKSVMLTNVVANQNIGGTAEPLEWYNKKGRTDAGTIIDGSAGAKATAEALTFRTIGTTVANGGSLSIPSPYRFYGYPNPTTEDRFEADGSFKEEQTRLVITAEIGGETCYYPVTLPTVKRNTAYEVELVIASLGSKDPDEVPRKGTVNATVTIHPWREGAVITETI